MNLPPPTIRSPEGQAQELLTDQAWAAIMRHFPGCTLHKTHDLHPADAIIRRRGEAIALVEIKTRRDFTEEVFWERHGGEWLLSAHKIDRNVPIAKKLDCAFLGAMHIVESKVVLLKTIWHAGKTCEHERRDTETRTNILDEKKKTRSNAFIPMQDAKRIAY